MRYSGIENTNKVILVTVSDDRFGRKDGAYKATQSKINIPGITCRHWDFAQIQKTDFYLKNQILLDNIDPARNGRAYKPFVIYDALLNCKDGEFVIYNDCSPEIWKHFFDNPVSNPDFEILKELTVSNKGIISPFVKWDSAPALTNGLGCHTHDNFTLDRCLRYMKAEDHRHDFMHASGFMCFQKSAFTLQFVKDWLHYNCIDECASMGKSGIPDDYSYWNSEAGVKMGHRHDQSISGILLNMHGFNLIDTPMPFEGGNPYNFLQYCNKNSKYQFISSINPYKPDQNKIRKGSKVLNENGVELTVYEIWPEEGIETYRVGKHPQSTYKTTAKYLRLWQK